MSKKNKINEYINRLEMKIGHINFTCPLCSLGMPFRIYRFKVRLRETDFPSCKSSVHFFARVAKTFKYLDINPSYES